MAVSISSRNERRGRQKSPGNVNRNEERRGGIQDEMKPSFEGRAIFLLGQAGYAPRRDIFDAAKALIYSAGKGIRCDNAFHKLPRQVETVLGRKFQCPFCQFVRYDAVTLLFAVNEATEYGVERMHAEID